MLFAGCGIFCGLAYLTRPEAVLVFAATMLVLGIGPFIRSWQQTWKLNLLHSLVLVLSTLTVGSPYFGFTRTFSNKPSTKTIWHGKSDDAESADAKRRKERCHGSATFASIFADTVAKNTPFTARLGKGLFVFTMELISILHYAGFLALLLGAAWRGKRLLAVPEFALPCVFIVLHSAGLLVLACRVGYLSNRHLLGVAVWGVFFAAAGFCGIPSWLQRYWPHRIGILRGPHLPRVSFVLLLAFVGLCLPRTMQKLHASQAGNHMAGLWLAENAKKGDFIRDDKNVSRYYAGEMFQHCPDPPPGRVAQCYIVMTRSRDAKVQEKQQRDGKNCASSTGRSFSVGRSRQQRNRPASSSSLLTGLGSRRNGGIRRRIFCGQKIVQKIQVLEC